MAHLTLKDKSFFKENGYLIKRGVLSNAQVQAARDALWDGIEADRNKPETWVQAGPRVPCPGSHPAIRATVQESPVFSMMEEMVGVGQLNGGGPGPHLVFPSGDDEWTGAKHGHLDGYYTPTNGVPEGTVGYMTINVTIYVEHIEHRGGCFTVFPGTHRMAHEYFKTHSLLSVQGGSSNRIWSDEEMPSALEFEGAPGDVCFWHGQMVHTGSKNVNRNIRMALIGRFSRKDSNDIRFETPDDMWADWEGLR
ncbi:MAG: phytanoyl-CoA dioxygenase family protein [Candidatus Latescibacterota bacterium]